jgi:hypothetical protein
MTWALVLMNFWVQANPMAVVPGFTSQETCMAAAAAVRSGGGHRTFNIVTVCVEVR